MRSVTPQVEPTQGPTGDDERDPSLIDGQGKQSTQKLFPRGSGRKERVGLQGVRGNGPQSITRVRAGHERVPFVPHDRTAQRKGVAYRPLGAEAILRRNMLIYGVGGLIVPFVGIKLIDLLLTAVGLA